MLDNQNTAGPKPSTPNTASGPMVSIIVVNYNGAESLPACLEALHADSYHEREIVVVDNASLDRSATVLKELTIRYPDLIVLWSKQNLGYAGGVNLALNSAHGDYIAVLNMDVVVEEGWLAPLVDFVENHAEVGAVNPLITLWDRKRVNALGQDIHITGLGFNRNLGRGLNDIAVAPLRVSGIQGGAFLMRRSLLERIGGMDVTGFLYHEDVNLSWMLNLMGFDLYCVPLSVVRHDYFLSMYAAKLYLLERNRWAMLLAYLHWSTLLLLSPVFLLTEALILGYSLLRGWSFLQAKLASYRWVLDHRTQIADRRRLAESLRVVTDRQLLSKMRWAYAWDQFVVLGRERGPSRRQPAGGIPREVINRSEV
jgi:GT2 family glycosyltransferase